MKCENCLYKNNCQFLAKHKNADVDDCTAFNSEVEFITKIKMNAIKEFAKRLKWRTHEISCNVSQVVTKDDIDALVKEMVGEM